LELKAQVTASRFLPGGPPASQKEANSLGDWGWRKNTGKSEIYEPERTPKVKGRCNAFPTFREGTNCKRGGAKGVHRSARRGSSYAKDDLSDKKKSLFSRRKAAKILEDGFVPGNARNRFANQQTPNRRGSRALQRGTGIRSRKGKVRTRSGK